MIPDRTPRYSLVALVLVFSLCMIGCGRNSGTTSSSARNKSLSERVLDLESEVQALQKQVQQRSSGFVSIHSEDKGYSIAQTRFGSFAVRCENVSQFMDGYKADLAVGNLTSVTFRGAKIVVSWGKSPVNKREITVADNFSPGSYSTVEFVMAPATPEDIKSFDLLFEFDEMAFHKEGR